MEIHVFFRGELPTKTALSRAMKELGFPFSIKPAAGSLEQQSGFMPMMLRREETGVEFDIYNDSAAFAEFAAKGVDPSLERRASLRWGGDADETAAGLVRRCRTRQAHERRGVRRGGRQALVGR